MSSPCSKKMRKSISKSTQNLLSWAPSRHHGANMVHLGCFLPPLDAKLAHLGAILATSVAEIPTKLSKRFKKGIQIRPKISQTTIFYTSGRDFHNFAYTLSLIWEPSKPTHYENETSWMLSLCGKLGLIDAFVPAGIAWNSRLDFRIALSLENRKLETMFTS